jgi:hypothetical protein
MTGEGVEEPEPEKLGVGGFRKTCPSRNVEFDEIHEMSFQGS